ncbi:MAG: hypothetical protein V3T70_11355 [Phycisphaerae bacterium]
MDDPGFLAQLFFEPIAIRGSMRLLLLVPLALSIAIIYKTIHSRELKEVPAASVVLCMTIVLGMLAVGAGLYVVFAVLA